MEELEAKHYLRQILTMLNTIRLQLVVIIKAVDPVVPSTTKGEE